MIEMAYACSNPASTVDDGIPLQPDCGRLGTAATNSHRYLKAYEL